MIIDLRSETPSEIKAQVVIVGAGAVGLLLGTQLARAGANVVICESGGRSPELASQALNEAEVSGKPHAGVSVGRARVLGGTTTLWGGQLVAFRPIDFERREWLAIDAWPVGYGELTDYYSEVAAILGLSSVHDDAEVWRSLSLPAPELGEDCELLLTRWLREPNFARLFRAELKTSNNLRVFLHAHATRLKVDERKARVAAVELVSPGQRRVDVAAEQIVVACGAIEASRLLLASARADPAAPWAGNDQVGACFQDHLDLRAAEVHPIDARRFHDAFDNIYLSGYKYQPKISLSHDSQRSNLTSNVAASFIFESSLNNHLSDLKMLVRALMRGAVPENLKDAPQAIAALAGMWTPLLKRYFRDRRAHNFADLGIHLAVHAEQIPIPQSRIRLSETRRDPYGVPLAHLDWQVDGAEVDAMATFCELLDRRLRANGLARLAIDPRLASRDRAILDDCQDTNHHCGGLCMGRNERTGVVDSNLRVFGTENLFVAGAAVFPSSSFANPTYTAMALALRLRDHLLEARHALH